MSQDNEHKKLLDLMTEYSNNVSSLKSKVLTESFGEGKELALSVVKKVDQLIKGGDKDKAFKYLTEIQNMVK